MKADTTQNKSFEEWLSDQKQQLEEAKRKSKDLRQRSEVLQQRSEELRQKSEELQQEREKRFAEIAREAEYYDKIIAYYKTLYNNQECKDATLV